MEEDDAKEKEIEARLMAKLSRKFNDDLKQKLNEINLKRHGEATDAEIERAKRFQEADEKMNEAQAKFEEAERKAQHVQDIVAHEVNKQLEQRDIIIQKLTTEIETQKSDFNKERQIKTALYDNLNQRLLIENEARVRTEFYLNELKNFD